ncbi:hypothetical protein GALMADRAFT_246080 [Galerina marginata CBS 339.88]|uniref:Uncharacterized protein n=1 Tax=Galerina marginata (strain CBS 339.88) TaxID=685588 RepID=A0A067T3S6_GALM3|nr:hypothetical protein GALMADRAFT_246080 [Galerina marginata CBS 339.88]
MISKLISIFISACLSAIRVDALSLQGRLSEGNYTITHLLTRFQVQCNNNSGHIYAGYADPDGNSGQWSLSRAEGRHNNSFYLYNNACNGSATVMNLREGGSVTTSANRTLAFVFDQALFLPDTYTIRPNTSHNLYWVATPTVTFKFNDVEPEAPVEPVRVEGLEYRLAELFLVNPI